MESGLDGMAGIQVEVAVRKGNVFPKNYFFGRIYQLKLCLIHVFLYSIFTKSLALSFVCLTSLIEFLFNDYLKYFNTKQCGFERGLLVSIKNLRILDIGLLMNQDKHRVMHEI